MFISILLLVLTMAPATDRPVRVYLHTKTDAQFVDADSKDRVRLVQDVQKKLKTKDIVTVERAADADLTVELTEQHGGAWGQYLTAVLSVGTYQTTIEARAGMTTTGAGSMADKIRKWIKDNRQQLLAAPAAP